jgi:hypothetical protein
VRGEGAEGIGGLGNEVADAGLLRGSRIVAVWVPGVSSDALERDLRRLGFVHRVGHEAGHLRRDVGAVPVGGAEQQVVADEVVHREIPPDVGLAADAAIDPFQRLQVNVGDDGLPVEISCDKAEVLH